MKKTKLSSCIYYLILVSAILQSCNSNDSSNTGYLVDAEIIGVKDGHAILAKIDLVSNEKTIVDSVTIKNGKFVFQGNLESPYLHTIFVNGPGGKFNAFLENSKIIVKGDIDDLANIKVSGSREDSLFRLYPIESIFDREIGMQIMMKYPTYAYSAFVAYYQFQLHNIQIDTIEYIIENFSEPVKKSEYYNHLFKLYNTIKQVAISQPAPDFKIPDTKDDTVQLSDFKGKYILIDFWASWCAPCRASNPALLEAYNLFKYRDFTIIGISVDKQKDRWLKAIEEDGLIWINLSNLEGWGEISTLYGVKAVPQNFLLDPQGIIIDKNIHSEQLIEKLNDVLPEK